MGYMEKVKRPEFAIGDEVMTPDGSAWEVVGVEWCPTDEVWYYHLYNDIDRRAEQYDTERCREDVVITARQYWEIRAKTCRAQFALAEEKFREAEETLAMFPADDDGPSFLDNEPDGDHACEDLKGEVTG